MQKGDITFMDALMYHISESQCNQESYLKLREYLLKQRYDTDSLKFDMNNGNINNKAFGAIIPNEINGFIKTQSCMSKLYINIMILRNFRLNK